LTSEEAKEQEIKAKREQLQQKIDYLYDQIRGEHTKQHSLQVTLKEVLSKEDHQQKIRDIIAEKADLDRRHQELIEENLRKRSEM
jgi:hypothetical protein